MGPDLSSDRKAVESREALLAGIADGDLMAVVDVHDWSSLLASLWASIDSNPEPSRPATP